MTNDAVGQSIARVDAVGKVTGQTLYPGDLTMPGMLHMKVLFARRPHARIKRLDVSKARSAPGVAAVLTAQDVPVNEFGTNERTNLSYSETHGSRPLQEAETVR